MPPAPVAIVTASSKGMGASCARLLAKRGYRLALFARDSELSDLATELDALAVAGDLADSVAIERLVQRPVALRNHKLVASKCGKVYRALLGLLVLNPAPPARRSNEWS